MTPRIKMAERRLRLLIVALNDGDATINEVFDAMEHYIHRVESLCKHESELIKELVEEIESPRNHGYSEDIEL